MDIRKLLGVGRPKRKAGVAQAGNYAAPVDPAGVDREMAETIGLRDEAAASPEEVKRRQIVSQETAAGRRNVRIKPARRLY